MHKNITFKMVIEDYTFPNNLIKIGENREDNDSIISLGKQCDIWFHLANFPSCHVIISTDKKYKATKKMIKYCAQLVKENTKYKNYKNLKVNYTELKNIKKTDVKGTVILKKTPQTISV